MKPIGMILGGAAAAALAYAASNSYRKKKRRKRKLIVREIVYEDGGQSFTTMARGARIRVFTAPEPGRTYVAAGTDTVSQVEGLNLKVPTDTSPGTPLWRVGVEFEVNETMPTGGIDEVYVQKIDVVTGEVIGEHKITIQGP